MKHILLLAVMFALVFASPAAPTEGDSGVSANAVDVEGVIIDGQQLAILKPGYEFREESRSSVAVMKTVRGARFQTGTLTCVRPGRRKGSCSVGVSADRAKCSSSCYFVGVRGGIKAG